MTTINRSKTPKAELADEFGRVVFTHVPRHAKADE